MSRYRLLNATVALALYHAQIIHEMRARGQTIDSETVENSLLSGSVRVARIRGYLFVFCVSGTWYDPTPKLVELGVYRVPGSRDGTFGDLIAGIQALARDEGCRRILVGTGAARNNAALARMYQRHGFEVDAWSLHKDIDERN